MATKKSTKKNGALRLYKSYMFKDKDPAIDKIRTLVEDSGESYDAIAAKSGVSAGTLPRWFFGDTKRPQFATLNATARALGHHFDLVPLKK